MSYLVRYVGAPSGSALRPPSYSEICVVMRLVGAPMTRGFWHGFYGFFGMHSPFHRSDFYTGERAGDFSRF